MKTKFILILFFISISNIAFADPYPYSDTLKLKIESKNYIIIHYHDWTSKTDNERFEMMTTDQNPFNSKNNYAYIECIYKKTGKTIFKKPSSALTKIQISEDEKYIVGISNIMIDNPFQLVIYTTSGELIKKRHISSEEAKLNAKELQAFNQKFPKQFSFLKSINRVYNSSNYTYIDFSSMGMPNKLGKAWDYLIEFISNNHLSKYFSESVTNWVFWFNEDDPRIKFKYVSNQLSHIELLDPNKKTFKIKIEE